MATNNMVQMLYDAAKSDTQTDANGIPKMDEQKLRRALNQNNKLGKRNRDNYEAGEPKFKSCPRYDPCPICDKCRAKASHLYVACQTCKIPICSHTYADRDRMIKRKNFEIMVEKEVMDEIKEIDLALMMKEDKEKITNRILKEQIGQITDITELNQVETIIKGGDSDV